MIPGAHRFHGYNSLNGVYRAGRNVRGQLVGLKFTNRAANKPYRVAVVVSRKISKSAVVRNRIRRRIYEAVRLSEGGVNPGTDLVFTVYSERVADLEPPKLRALVEGLIGETGQNS